MSYNASCKDVLPAHMLFGQTSVEIIRSRRLCIHLVHLYTIYYFKKMYTKRSKRNSSGIEYWLNSRKVCSRQIIFYTDVERQNCIKINTYCQSVECNRTTKKRVYVFSANFAPWLRFVPRLCQPNLTAVQLYSFFSVS